jgi:hypothetical protein
MSVENLSHSVPIEKAEVVEASVFRKAEWATIRMHSYLPKVESQ